MTMKTLLFPTAPASDDPDMKYWVASVALWPITGVITGTPPLIAKLTAGQRKKRAEATELRIQQEALTAKATADAEDAFQRKLEAELDADKRAAMVEARETARLTARQVKLEQAKVTRKAKRSKLGDSAGAAALLLIVGGPLVWSLARPWIPTVAAVAAAAWWLVALMHAPTPATMAAAAAAAAKRDRQADPEESEESDPDQDEPNVDQGDDDHADKDDSAPAPQPLTHAELATTIEQMVAIRATRDGGAGNLLLSEALAALQHIGHYQGSDTREFGAAVRAANMPPAPSVGVVIGDKRKTSTGWSVSYLRGLLGRAPSLPPRPAVDHTPAQAA
ncbi:hypothetical protein ACIHEI_14275 [Kitasatospora sp. NPDC051984]|uniref:hypothetical protein n=1 Tax=Kitasatospora sp. NPDC051984 TaxID=3364059 RepID=UPI0037C5FE4E